jgi:hypothetical protein
LWIRILRSLTLLQKSKSEFPRLHLTPHLSPRQKLTQMQFHPTKRMAKRKETRRMTEKETEKTKAEAQAAEKEKPDAGQKKYDGGKIPRAPKS